VALCLSQCPSCSFTAIAASRDAAELARITHELYTRERVDHYERTELARALSRVPLRRDRRRLEREA
jgi:hypothetical protein